MLSTFKAGIRTALNNQRMRSRVQHDSQMLLLGKLLCRSNLESRTLNSITDYEFKVFSQFGDDGIIQWLIRAINVKHECFIEFGVADYYESNTRFLLMNNNWSGLVLDGSPANVEKIRSSNLMWRHELYAKAAFVDTDNVNQLLSDHPFGREIGLLHIDVDGNDYWLWEAIDVVSPAIAIVEYNSIFGCERAITVPYRPDFQRAKAHSSHLYYGASLAALNDLATRKGFTFIGCNSAGNNAYFVRNDHLVEALQVPSLQTGFVESKFRECRNAQGQLTYVSNKDRIEQIRGLPVWNTRSNGVEQL